jgi:hypothetical protein
MSKAAKDSPKVVEFMTLFARLKEWCDDAPDDLAELVKSDSSIKDVCDQLSFAANFLRMNERRHRALFEKELQGHLDESRRQIVEYYLPRVVENPPDAMRGTRRPCSGYVPVPACSRPCAPSTEPRVSGRRIRAWAMGERSILETRRSRICSRHFPRHSLTRAINCMSCVVDRQAFAALVEDDQQLIARALLDQLPEHVGEAEDRADLRAVAPGEQRVREERAEDVADPSDRRCPPDGRFHRCRSHRGGRAARCGHLKHRQRAAAHLEWHDARARPNRSMSAWTCRICARRARCSRRSSWHGPWTSRRPSAGRPGTRGSPQPARSCLMCRERLEHRHGDLRGSEFNACLALASATRFAAVIGWAS